MSEQIASETSGRESVPRTRESIDKETADIVKRYLADLPSTSDVAGIIKRAQDKRTKQLVPSAAPSGVGINYPVHSLQSARRQLETIDPDGAKYATESGREEARTLKQALLKEVSDRELEYSTLALSLLPTIKASAKEAQVFMYQQGFDELRGSRFMTIEELQSKIHQATQYFKTLESLLSIEKTASKDTINDSGEHELAAELAIERKIAEDLYKRWDNANREWHARSQKQEDKKLQNVESQIDSIK